MTSERKIAANRQNSRQSSGPRTRVGKLKVRHNALRHGLAAIPDRSPTVAAEVDHLARAIAGNHADAARREQALIIAESEFELLRARASRAKMFEQMLAPGGAEARASGNQAGVRRSTEVDPQSQLRRLIRLERYERRAVSKRKKAIRRLLELEPSELKKLVITPPQAEHEPFPSNTKGATDETKENHVVRHTKRAAAQALKYRDLREKALEKAIPPIEHMLQEMRDETVPARRRIQLAKKLLKLFPQEASARVDPG